jgi:hypothetical protein
MERSPAWEWSSQKSPRGKMKKNMIKLKRLIQP